MREIDKPDTVEEILTERGNRYGKFEDHAAIAQDIKMIMRRHDQWAYLASDKKEALEMIAHKIARIINGDSNYVDSWVDIAGYAKLVADRLQGISR